MLNVAVFRVPKKAAKNNNRRHIILMLAAVLSIIWLFNKACIASIVYLGAEGSSLVQSTDSSIFKGLLEDSFPVIKPGQGAGRNLNGGALGVLAGYALPANILDCKSVLNTQYPVLRAYYIKCSVGGSPNPDSQNGTQPGQNPQKVAEAQEDEGELDAGDKESDASYNRQINMVESSGIRVRNHTSYQIDLEKLKKEPLKLECGSQKTGIIILHTHTSEAYTPTQKNSYKPSDPHRTENPRYNVVRVGDELKKQLFKYGIRAAHDTTIHDFPTYTGSYRRSLQTAQKAMQKYPSAKVIFDIHRDALGEPEEKLRSVVRIGSVEAAKLMLVVGTDQLGLKHDNWRENLKLAVKIQQEAARMYPGLCKDIDLRKERFNQHVAAGALIIEVGGTGNTLEEAEASMKYLAEVAAKVLD